MDAGRLKRLDQAAKEAGVDAVFVSNPKNVEYLTGFKCTMPSEVQPFGDPEGFLVLHAGQGHFLCDGRYIEGARQLPNVTAHQISAPTSAKVISEKIRELVGTGAKSIGFERDALLYGDAAALLELLPNYRWQGLDGVLAGLRVVKTPEEVQKIRQAQEITCSCFDHMRKFVKTGMTERHVAVEIETYLRANSDGNSFKPIVAFGETACNPHYTPSPKRKLEKNQMVLLDFGGIYDGYCGDMTRMLFNGKADARYREVYELVLQAQTRCAAAVAPGKTCHELDSICRDYFKSKNCAEAFMHGTGHGVGLAIHEDPRIKQTFQTKVQPGMVFSVEPGLYFAGWGGIRIEDLVVVTQSGYDNLTRSPKDLLEIDA